MATVYRVLEINHSSSSSAEYQLRRGGDGVLYCECNGWKMNKPAPGEPKKCTHTKNFVAENPGTMYGPPGRFNESRSAAATATPQRAGSSGKSRRPAPASPIPVPVATAPAPKNWRDVLLVEAKRAEARGVVTPADVARAYEQEIGRFANLDVEEAVSVAPSTRGSARALDVE